MTLKPSRFILNYKYNVTDNIYANIIIIVIKQMEELYMIYKKATKIDEEISAIGLGCWNFGGDWDNSNEEKSMTIVDKAIDLGINLFDIAPVYGLGISETVLGKALKRNGKRKKIIIASKCGLVWDNKNNVTRNLTKKSILKEIDDSLLRLQTDYIDIYQLHWPDHDTPLEETAEALNQIKKSGKIRYIGLTNYSADETRKMMELSDIATYQSLYNMLERNTTSYHNTPLEYKTESEIFPVVKEFGLAYFPYSPLFQGLLSGRFNPSGNFSTKDVRNSNPKLNGENFTAYYEVTLRLKAFADNLQKPLSEVAFNWLRQKEEVTSIIGGAKTTEQLEQNVACVNWELTSDELVAIDDIIKPFENI